VSCTSKGGKKNGTVACVSRREEITEFRTARSSLRSWGRDLQRNQWACPDVARAGGHYNRQGTRRGSNTDTSVFRYCGGPDQVKQRQELRETKPRTKGVKGVRLTEFPMTKFLSFWEGCNVSSQEERRGSGRIGGRSTGPRSAICTLSCCNSRLDQSENRTNRSGRKL